MFEVLKKEIRLAVLELGLSIKEVNLEFPAELSHGDYATSVALALAKQAGENPRALAEKIVSKLGEIEHVSKIEVAGPGFINFYLSPTYFSEIVNKTNDLYGENSELKNKIVLIEYTSPNLFKPLHIGNLVGNILGESISRLFEKSGAKVERINYPSDIGLTVAKGVWGLKNKGLNPDSINDLGEAYILGNEAYENEGREKEEIISINKALYAESDAELNSLRDRGIATSKKHLDELCEKLGTQFDAVFFESESGVEGEKVISEHIGDVFEKSEGAVVYKGERDGLHTRVFLNSEGLPTYEAKEVGLFNLKRNKYPNFDRYITVTGGEQKDFFKVVFVAIKKIFPDETAGKDFKHLATGFLTLTTGKMSSRKGNVITGESLISEMEQKALQKMEERDLGERKEKIASKVAVAAIKYSILKQSTGKDIVFDPEQSLSFEGDSGPYLQYSYVRANSVLEKAETKNGSDMIYHITERSEEISDLERLLPRFPTIVERSAREYEPHYTTTYLTELASEFNSWYAKEKIIGSPDEAYKLKVVNAFAHTMKNGLWLLGIEAPERM